MSLRLVAVLSLSLVGALGSVADAQQNQVPTQSAWTQPAEPFRIAGPIHYVGTADLAVYLVTTPEGHVLIDGGVKEATPLIEQSIRALGFKVEDIRVLLTTQVHYDHVASMAAFQRASKARVEVMREDAPILESGGRKDYLFSQWGESAAYEPVKPTRLLRDGDTVSLGGITLTAHATPGHTPGCTTWTTTIQDGAKSYRVVFAGSTFVNPGTQLAGKESYPGIAKDYARSFTVLESLRPEIFLAGHASAFDLHAKRERLKAGAAENPFIDPEGFRKGVAASKRAFERLLAEQRAAAASK